MIAIAISALVACKKTKKEVLLTAQESLDISYENHVQQKFDLYLPANRDLNTKVILFLHGGGFVAGDKSDFTQQSKALAAKGFAVLNANYRLVDTTGLLREPPLHRPSAVTIHTQMEDMDALLETIRAKATEWQVSSENIATAGHSAGGTLALLAAFNNKDKVKATANWAGVTNFSFPDESYATSLPPFLAEAYYRIVGQELKNENKLAFMAVSPIWIAISGKSVPTINVRPEFNVVFGLPDASKAEYQEFTNALNAANTINQSVEIAGADHGFGQPGNWIQVVAVTSDFFNQQMR